MKRFLKVATMTAMIIAVVVMFCSCTGNNDTTEKLSNNFEKEVITEEVITEEVITENIEVETIEPKCVGERYCWGSTITYWDWSK